MKIYNPVEEHLFKVIIFFLSVLTIPSIIIDELSPAGYSLVLKVFFIFVYLIILWYGREKIFSFVINYVPGVNIKSKLNGEWTISINFKDMDELDEKSRFGPVSMTSSLLGLKIQGKKLQDKKTNEITMPRWYADTAELVIYDGHEILYYLYKIPVENSLVNNIEKIGFVCAYRKANDKVFTGFFRDIRIISGIGKPHLREGSITLMKND